MTPSDQLMAGYGRKPPQQIEDGVPPYLFVSAQRAGDLAEPHHPRRRTLVELHDVSA